MFVSKEKIFKRAEPHFGRAQLKMCPWIREDLHSDARTAERVVMPKPIRQEELRRAATALREKVEAGQPFVDRCQFQGDGACPDCDRHQAMSSQLHALERQISVLSALALLTQSPPDVSSWNTWRATDGEGAELPPRSCVDADLRGVDFSKTRLGHSLDIWNTSSDGPFEVPYEWNLEGADLREACFEGTEFEGTSLTGANLRGARLAKARFGHAGDLACRLTSTCLENADLSWADITGADFDKAILRGSTLVGARLHEVSLRNADLGDADLRGVSLTTCDVEGASLRGARVAGLELLASQLEQVEVEPSAVQEIAVRLAPRQIKGPRVFICYAHADRLRATQIAEELRAVGADPWLDHEALALGDDFAHEIRDALRVAEAVVVCLSRTFRDTGFRQREVRWALEEAEQREPGKGFLIPFLLEPCDIPGWCRSLHVGDTSSVSTIRELIAAVARHCATSLHAAHPAP